MDELEGNMQDDLDKIDTYWAAAPSDEIADEILDRVDEYYKYISATGRLANWKRSHIYYYRPRTTGARLNPSGEQGELTTLSVNHFRNLLMHLETMTTQQKLTFQPRASNSDVKSQSQCILADSLLNYYLSEKRLERNIKQAVKDALMYGEGFLRIDWDATMGDVYGKTPTGATIYAGDIKYSNYTPLDTVRDFTKTSAGQDDWYILRNFENKFNLTAKYKAVAKDILSNPMDLLKIASTTQVNIMALEESDNIPVYTLIHKPTPALPQGRYTMILDNGIVLMDGPIPYEDINVFRISPDEESGSIFGFSVAFDLLAMQECMDILYSTIITNQTAFGVQNIVAPKGFDLSISKVAGGLNLLECDLKLGEPHALQLLATPPEIFKFMQEMEHLMETISGVNSVARGNPEASLKSGAALALVQSMALQFSLSLQQSYAQLAEDVGTGTINLLKTFASTPRVATIVGKANRPLMKEFTGDDLNMIKRVTVDMGNPMTNTVAGKVNIAEQLMQMNLIENHDQYQQVLATGRLDPVIEGKQAQLLLIKGENEQLSEGIPQRVLITDNHQKHILEHTSILANPEIRQDPNSPIIAATLGHIQEHMDMANDPNVQRLMSVLHQEPIPPMMPPPQMAGPGQGGQGNLGPAMNGQPPVMQKAGEVKKPNMPSPPKGTDPRSADIINQQKGAPQ